MVYPPVTNADGSVSLKTHLYESGVTDMDSSGNDNYPGLVAEIGYGLSSDTSGWKWVKAGYAGNYIHGAFEWSIDEFTGAIETGSKALNVGYRFKLVDTRTGRESSPLYCGAQGVVKAGDLNDGQWILIDAITTVKTDSIN